VLGTSSKHDDAEIGADVNTSTDGENPVSLCALQRDVACAIVAALLDAGGNTKGRSPVNGASALMLATAANGSVCVKLLLKAGADIRAVDKYEMTALHVAANVNIENTIIAELLLKAGAELDAKDDIGFTPLHMAVQSGNCQCADMLIKSGASVDVKTGEGDSTLMLACKKECSDCVDLLLKAGADKGSGRYKLLHSIASCCSRR
jgi:ankyrin repeat protein